MSISTIDLDWLDDALGEGSTPKHPTPGTDCPDWLDDICGELGAPPDPLEAARETWSQYLRGLTEARAVGKLQQVASIAGTGLIASTKFSRWGSRDIPPPPAREDLRGALLVVARHLRGMAGADAGAWLQGFARNIGLNVSRSLYGQNKPFTPGGQSLGPGNEGA